MKKLSFLRRLLIIVSACVFLISGGLLLKNYIEGKKAEKSLSEAKALYPGVTAASSKNESSSAQEELSENTEGESTELVIPPMQEDFYQLYEQNEDIAGWLIAGDTVDHPVVQTYDNSYYSEINFQQWRDPHGTLFVNCANKLYPLDDVTIIYGHKMGNGDMFGKLHRYEREAFLAEYPIISFRTIYDEEEVYYTPVSIFHASMNPSKPSYFNINQIRFKDDAPGIITNIGTERQSTAFQTYLDEILERSKWEAKTDVTVDDRLLMLATCSYAYSDGEMMLVCRALREGETPESIRTLYSE